MIPSVLPKVNDLRNRIKYIYVFPKETNLKTDSYLRNRIKYIYVFPKANELKNRFIHR